MKGVAAYLKQEHDGKLRLVFNDVEATSDSENPDWKHSVLFTSNCYEADSLKDASLSKEQYSEIGENLVLRLLVLGGYFK